MYDKFTAEDAKRTALESLEPVFSQVMTEILYQVEETAMTGRNTLVVEDHGFGSCDTDMRFWPKMCSVVFRELKELGYKVEIVKYKDKIYRVWLEVSW